MRVRARFFVVGLGASIAGLAGAASAQAYNSPSYWNVSSTPLKVSGYGSTAQAYGYIKIFNGSSGTRMYGYAWNKFVDGDNHRAYLNGATQFNAGTCSSSSSTVIYKGAEVSNSSSCTFQFADNEYIRVDGLNYTSSTWIQMPNKSWGVHSGSDRGRLKVNLNIDIPWRSDPAVGPSYSSSDSFS